MIGIERERLASIREVVKHGPDGRLMGAWDGDPRAEVLAGYLDEVLAEFDRFQRIVAWYWRNCGPYPRDVDLGEGLNPTPASNQESRPGDA